MSLIQYFYDKSLIYFKLFYWGETDWANEPSSLDGYLVEFSVDIDDVSVVEGSSNVVEVSEDFLNCFLGHVTLDDFILIEWTSEWVCGEA